MTNSELQQHLNIIEKYAERGQNVEAIKYIRSHTNLDLRRSKELYEHLSKGGEIPPEFFSARQITDTQVEESLSETLLAEVINLLQKGKKLGAVKVVKENTNWTLKEAKEFVDNLAVDEFRSLGSHRLGQDGYEKIDDDIGRFAETEETKTKNSGKRGNQFDEMTFSKSSKRDAMKKRRRNNSGCMVSLSLIAVVSVLTVIALKFIFQS